MNSFEEYVFDRHDVYCNQIYGDNLPYSFHLQCVFKQGMKFGYLVKDVFSNIIQPALYSHDTLEDARMTYNDLVHVLDLSNYKESEKIADIVFLLTDEKGKNRAERKNEKYYKELAKNKLAVFVKLSDIAANTLYSKLTGSSMYDKYKKEFPSFKEKVYVEEYKEFFDYVETL